jgi:hypothetical protein
MWALQITRIYLGPSLEVFICFFASVIFPHIMRCVEVQSHCQKSTCDCTSIYSDRTQELVLNQIDQQYKRGSYLSWSVICLYIHVQYWGRNYWFHKKNWSISKNWLFTSTALVHQANQFNFIMCKSSAPVVICKIWSISKNWLFTQKELCTASNLCIF